MIALMVGIVCLTVLVLVSLVVGLLLGRRSFDSTGPVESDATEGEADLGPYRNKLLTQRRSVLSIDMDSRRLELF